MGHSQSRRTPARGGVPGNERPRRAPGPLPVRQWTPQCGHARSSVTRRAIGWWCRGDWSVVRWAIGQIPLVPVTLPRREIPLVGGGLREDIAEHLVDPPSGDGRPPSALLAGWLRRAGTGLIRLRTGGGLIRRRSDAGLTRPGTAAEVIRGRPRGIALLTTGVAVVPVELGHGAIMARPAERSGGGALPPTGSSITPSAACHQPRSALPPAGIRARARGRRTIRR